MQRSVLGYYCIIGSTLCALCHSCLSQERYGLAVFLFLNAFTNLVNTIHAFYGTLF